MTEVSGEGMTEVSPKEDTNINNINLSNNPLRKEEKERVRKYLRNGIFRNRIFETFDNLKEHTKIEDLVEEGSFRATKEILINRASSVLKTHQTKRINPADISKKVRKEFPYKNFPKEEDKARKFFVAKICDITSKEILKELN